MAVRATFRARVAQLRVALKREDGWAATAITFPLLFVAIVGCFQLALWFLGNDVAQSAAVNAYNQSRSYQSTDAAGVRAGTEIVDANGEFLKAPTVRITRTAESVTVTVTGRPLALIPGMNLPTISRSVTGPIERWVPK